MSGLTDAKAAVRRFWKTRSRYSFLRTPLITRYEGGWLLAYPDEMGYVMFFKRGFENDERRAFQKLLRSGRIHTVIDVGANQGLYALTAARWLPAGRVIAFEPVEGEASKLSRNISLNRYSNITVEHLAVGARVEEASIFIALSGMGAYSSLRPPAEDVQQNGHGSRPCHNPRCVRRREAIAIRRPGQGGCRGGRTRRSERVRPSHRHLSTYLHGRGRGSTVEAVGIPRARIDRSANRPGLPVVPGRSRRRAEGAHRSRKLRVAEPFRGGRGEDQACEHHRWDRIGTMMRMVAGLAGKAA